MVTGCLPISANTGAVFSGGTISGNLAVTGNLSGGSINVGSPTGGFVAGVLNAATDVRVNNSSVGISGGTYTGNLTVTGTLTSTGLLTASAGATVTGTTQTTDLYVTRSMGLAQAPDGTSAHFSAPAGGMAFSNSGSGFPITTLGAFSATGTIQSNTGFYGNTTAIISGVTTIAASSSITGSSLSVSTIGAHTLTGAIACGGYNITGAGSITASTDITSSGTLHVTGASAFTGGVILNAGCSISQSGGSSGITVDNIAFNTSLYQVGVTGGNISNAINVKGSAGNPTSYYHNGSAVA